MLGRLTDNEKQCLRRRLLSQTAKEMAIDLGISPHAVEKRLKMARTKLGLSSSLEAARLLAAVEGYQQTIPRRPDLALPGSLGHLTHQVRRISRRHLFWGAMLMIPFSAGVFALILAIGQQSAADSIMRKASFDEAVSLAGENLDHLDRDRSGLLDAREAGAMEPLGEYRDPSLPAVSAAAARDPAGEAKWMAKLDSDRDHRVSRGEYVGYMTPWILASGVPASWKPRE